MRLIVCSSAISHQKRGPCQFFPPRNICKTAAWSLRLSVCKNENITHGPVLDHTWVLHLSCGIQTHFKTSATAPVTIRYHSKVNWMLILACCQALRIPRQGLQVHSFETKCPARQDFLRGKHACMRDVKVQHQLPMRISHAKKSWHHHKQALT